MILKVNLALWIFFVFSDSAYSTDPLDTAILGDIIPSVGSKCNINLQQANANDQTTGHTFEYQESPTTWHTEASPVEQDLFLAEISHVNGDNQNRSWVLRVGQGGNIYSFRSGFGEAVAPQVSSSFVDEVFQSVSVNQEKNLDSEKIYFIHQAGVYQQDGEFTEKPFFSPSIAKSCNDEGCSFGSWGQQAHVETFHKSDILYFNNYRDCGDGVIEVTSVVHNAAADLDNGDDVDYLNVPWGGTRQSTLRDVFTSEVNGDLKMSFPPKYFLRGDGGDEDISNTGGYTVFAERMLVSDEQYNQFPFETPFDLRFIIDRNPPSFPSPTHNNNFGMETCMSTWIELVDQNVQFGCRDCELWFTNSRTLERLYVKVVVHWAWDRNRLYFCPEDITSGEFNESWMKGDEILVSYANVGKPIEDNLGLSFVHGTQGQLEQRWSPTRSRHGKSGLIVQDHTVYTINPRVQIKPGDTYVYQQYIITGEMSDMRMRSPAWVDQVYEDIFPIGEMSGTEIHLYSNDENSFGASVEGGDVCSQGISICSGWSVPSFGMIPLFAITCGDKKYVGSDKYHFSPSQLNEISTIRSYNCEGEPTNVRPSWKLLGFFSEGSCEDLANSTYDPHFCSSTTSPAPTTSTLTLPPTISTTSLETVSSSPTPGPVNPIIAPVTTIFNSADEFLEDPLIMIFPKSTAPSQSPTFVSRSQSPSFVSRSQLFNSFLDSLLCGKKTQDDRESDLSNP